jgi:hypothetical protein
MRKDGTCNDLEPCATEFSGIRTLDERGAALEGVKAPFRAELSYDEYPLIANLELQESNYLTFPRAKPSFIHPGISLQLGVCPTRLLSRVSSPDASPTSPCSLSPFVPLEPGFDVSFSVSTKCIVQSLRSAPISRAPSPVQSTVSGLSLTDI